MDMLQKTFTRFQGRKDAIYSLWQSFPGLDPKLQKWAIEYFDSFYKTIGDTRTVERELRRPCTR
jgi:hypothetical protein